jgi:hypothetical protein
MFEATDIHVIHFLVGYLEWVAPHITKMDDERKVLQAAVKKGPLDAGTAVKHCCFSGN